jgi:hypothetical protein
MYDDWNHSKPCSILKIESRLVLDHLEIDKIYTFEEWGSQDMSWMRVDYLLIPVGGRRVRVRSLSALSLTVRRLVSACSKKRWTTRIGYIFELEMF